MSDYVFPFNKTSNIKLANSSHGRAESCGEVDFWYDPNDPDFDFAKHLKSTPQALKYDCDHVVDRDNIRRCYGSPKRGTPAYYASGIDYLVEHGYFQDSAGFRRSFCESVYGKDEVDKWNQYDCDNAYKANVVRAGTGMILKYMSEKRKK